MKEDTENEIILQITNRRRISAPVKVHFVWYEETKRRDKDNVAFAKKFILDAFQKCGILPNDNNKWVEGFTDSFVYGKGQGVVIKLEELQ